MLSEKQRHDRLERKRTARRYRATHRTAAEETARKTRVEQRIADGAVAFTQFFGAIAKHNRSRAKQVRAERSERLKQRPAPLRRPLTERRLGLIDDMWVPVDQNARGVPRLRRARRGYARHG